MKKINHKQVIGTKFMIHYKLKLNIEKYSDYS